MASNYDENGDNDKDHKGTFHMKMLIDKSSAGIVIGKAGAVISAIERATHCSLQISPVHLVFPGTNERVLLLHGTPQAVPNAVLAILEKIWAYNAEQMEPAVPCRFAVPSSAAAAIIGKAGTRIQGLQSETGTQIRVSERQDGVAERVVSINGSVPAVRDVALRIIEAVSNDPNLNGQPASARNFGTAMMTFNSSMGFPGNGPSRVESAGALAQHCEIEMRVPDEITGYVLGKKGAFVQHVIHSTRAQVKISAKGDLVPGTDCRRFTISGPLSSVHAAHTALVLRVAEARHEKDSSAGQGRPRGSGGGHAKHEM